MSTKNTDRRRPGRPPNPISRQRLLEVAREVFAEKGYAGASLSEIARQAGLRKASLYHHFSTKDSLYLSVLDRLVHDIRELFIATHIDEGGFTARLERTASRALDYLDNNIDGARILARDMIDRGPFMQNHGQKTLDLTLRLGASFLQQGMEAGEFKRHNPEQLILSLVGMCLYSYATAEISARILGEADSQSRKRRLMEPIRALCLIEDPLRIAQPANPLRRAQAQ